MTCTEPNGTYNLWKKSLEWLEPNLYHNSKHSDHGNDIILMVNIVHKYDLQANQKEPTNLEKKSLQ